MKVLVISHMYPSTFNPIAGIFVHKQVKTLINKGCEVKVVSPVPWAPFPLNKISRKWEKYSNIPLKQVLDEVEVYYPRYIEFPRGLFFQHSGYFMYLGIRKVVEEIYKEFKFDIIHSHVAIPDGFCGVNINKNYNKPQVVTIHGQDFQQTIYKNKACHDKLFYVLNKVDSIVTVSNKLKNIIKDEEFFNKARVVNNGIDLEDCKTTKKMVLKSSEDEISILSVSNLAKIKGIDINLKAISKLVDKYPNIRYYIVGGGSEREYLSKLTESLKLESYVKFIGKLEHSKAMEYMEACHIFSMPSWKEGFGVVYLEAMSFGKPVIGVRGQGIEDILEHGVNGYLVEPQNVEDTANALEKLINSSELRRNIGIKGKETVENKCTWDKNADAMMKIYNELMTE